MTSSIILVLNYLYRRLDVYTFEMKVAQDKKAKGKAVEGQNAQLAKAARQGWMGVLAKAAVSELEALVGALGEVPRYRFLRLPETGLTMVRGRAGGVGQVFNLGEMTLTRCVVQLMGEGEDEPITGFGYVGGRSHRHAELAALCDGLMQHEDWQAQVREMVIEPLMVIAQKERAQVQQRTSTTTVDFFTMLRGQ